MKWDEFFVTGDPMIYGADVSIVLTMVGILFYLTKYKKWKWLWDEWLTTVDHKNSVLCISFPLCLCCSVVVSMHY